MLSAVLLCALAAHAQQRTCIAGLESNPEYRTLVVQEKGLSEISDSIARSINDIRRSFRTDTLNRSALTAAILRMEDEAFDVRSRLARVTGQINAIEQEWILKCLDTDPATDIAAVAGSGEKPEKTVANLVFNAYFDRNLRHEDVRDLRHAQDEEANIPPLVERFRENNGRLLVLKYAYNLALTAGIADSIKMRFDSLARVNRSLDAEIAGKWSTIFDNKSYAYNFLMDKGNRTDLRRRYDSDLENAVDRQARLRGVYASEAIAAYAIRKKLITGYEMMFARELGNDAAYDSLAGVQARLPDAEELTGFDPVELKERLFLDFSDIEFLSSPRYGAGNPVPEVKVYPKGIIYRVLLGTYSSSQPPSAFRNTAPLAVQEGVDGKFRYFAGGFPTDSTVNAAVGQMAARGFRKPEAVVWMDGVYINLAAGKGLADAFYRIEMSGVREPLPETKEVIRKVTGGRDILRAGDTFIVGPLDSAAEAVRLRSALEGRDPAMEIKITEIID